MAHWNLGVCLSWKGGGARLRTYPPPHENPLKEDSGKEHHRPMWRPLMTKSTMAWFFMTVSRAFGEVTHHPPPPPPAGTNSPSSKSVHGALVRRTPLFPDVFRMSLCRRSTMAFPRHHPLAGISQQQKGLGKSHPAIALLAPSTQRLKMPFSPESEGGTWT